jgi:hypothetical protein
VFVTKGDDVPILIKQAALLHRSANRRNFMTGCLQAQTGCFATEFFPMNKQTFAFAGVGSAINILYLHVHFPECSTYPLNFVLFHQHCCRSGFRGLLTQSLLTGEP